MDGLDDPPTTSLSHLPSDFRSSEHSEAVSALDLDLDTFLAARIELPHGIVLSGNTQNRSNHQDPDHLTSFDQNGTAENTVQ